MIWQHSDGTANLCAGYSETGDVGEGEVAVLVPSAVITEAAKR